MKRLTFLFWLFLVAPAFAQVNIETANFTWTYDTATQGPVTRWRIQCGLVTGGPYGIITTVSDPTLRQLPVNQVLSQPGAYFCIITAINEFGHRDSAEFAVNAGRRPGPDSVQGGVSKNPASIDQDKFVWKYSDNIVVTEWRVRCGPTTGDYTEVGVVADPAAREAAMSAVLKNPGPYFCVVAGVTPFGNRNSAEFTVTAGRRPGAPVGGVS